MPMVCMSKWQVQQLKDICKATTKRAAHGVRSYNGKYFNVDHFDMRTFNGLLKRGYVVPSQVSLNCWRISEDGLNVLGYTLN